MMSQDTVLVEEEQLHYGCITKTAHLPRPARGEARASSPEATTTCCMSELQKAQAVASCLPTLWDVSQSPGVPTQRSEVISKQADVSYGFTDGLFIIVDPTQIACLSIHRLFLFIKRAWYDDKGRLSLSRARKSGSWHGSRYFCDIGGC